MARSPLVFLGGEMATVWSERGQVSLTPVRFEGARTERQMQMRCKKVGEQFIGQGGEGSMVTRAREEALDGACSESAWRGKERRP